MFISTKSLRAKTTHQAFERNYHSVPQTSSRTVGGSQPTSSTGQYSDACHWLAHAITDHQRPVMKCWPQRSGRCPNAPCPLCYRFFRPHRRMPASRPNIALCPCQLDFESTLAPCPSCFTRLVRHAASQLRHQDLGLRSQFLVVSKKFVRNIIRRLTSFTKIIYALRHFLGLYKFFDRPSSAFSSFQYLSLSKAIISSTYRFTSLGGLLILMLVFFTHLAPAFRDLLNDFSHF